MKSNKKTFIPDLSGYVSGLPGQGQIRYGARVISNVRFNEFEPGSTGRVFVDKAEPDNTYSFQSGVPDSSLESVVTEGALSGRKNIRKPCNNSPKLCRFFY